MAVVRSYWSNAWRNHEETCTGIGAHADVSVCASAGVDRADGRGQMDGLVLGQDSPAGSRDGFAIVPVPAHDVVWNAGHCRLRLRRELWGAHHRLRDQKIVENFWNPHRDVSSLDSADRSCRSGVLRLADGDGQYLC